MGWASLGRSSDGGLWYEETKMHSPGPSFPGLTGTGGTGTGGSRHSRAMRGGREPQAGGADRAEGRAEGSEPAIEERSAVGERRVVCASTP